MVEVSPEILEYGERFRGMMNGYIDAMKDDIEYFEDNDQEHVVYLNVEIDHIDIAVETSDGSTSEIGVEYK